MHILTIFKEQEATTYATVLSVQTIKHLGLVATPNYRCHNQSFDFSSWWKTLAVTSLLLQYSSSFCFCLFYRRKKITAIHEETCLLRRNGFWNMKGTNNAYLTINWVYRYIFYLLVCLLVCVSYMEWQLKTWKINQQLLPHQTDTTPRRNCICCYISTLTWVGLSFCPSQIYTNTHPFTQHVHTHISSPIYFAQTPSLPPTHRYYL